MFGVTLNINECGQRLAKWFENKNAKTGRISKTKTETTHRGKETGDTQRPRQSRHNNKTKTDQDRHSLKTQQQDPDRITIRTHSVAMDQDQIPRAA